MTTVNVPEGFLLGVATSAYQVEGAANAGGRSPSIWDTFSHTPGKVRDDVPGDRGAEQYARLEEDLNILSDLGVGSYRFSISWSRLIPDGTGRPNPDGVEYYDRLIDGLIERGIAPNVTLYHWDLPQVLEDRGGWTNRAVVDWFAEYSRTAFDLFGDRVPLWCTINEPIALWVGYGLGVFAPGIADAQKGKQAMHHAMVAHGRAVQEFRSSAATGNIGIVVDVWKRHLVADTTENKRIAERDEDDSFRFFYDELFAGGLSRRLVERLRSEGTMPEILPGDYETAAEPMDYLGINVYSRVLVDSENYSQNWWEGNDTHPGGNYLSNGTELYAFALRDAVEIARSEYGFQGDIYITENGTSADAEPIDGQVDDAERVQYVSAFLQEAIRAHDDGLGVKGYYLWSLLDNYEWSAAYSMRYGIVRVDPTTFDRTYKSSAYWYREVNRRRRLPLHPRVPLEVVP
jgi:beta-glucosidase